MGQGTELHIICGQVALVVKSPLSMQEACRFHPWVGKIPWKRSWQPIPVFLPGEFHGQRSLAGTVHGVSKSWTQLKSLSKSQERAGMLGLVTGG